MSSSTLKVSLGPIGVTGTGYGTGAAVIIVIAIVIWLIEVRPPFFLM